MTDIPVIVSLAKPIILESQGRLDFLSVYWEELIHRHEALLNEPALPIQTLRIARERLEEARSVIRAIDAGANEESEHGDRANR